MTSNAMFANLWDGDTVQNDVEGWSVLVLRVHRDGVDPDRDSVTVLDVETLAVLVIDGATWDDRDAPDAWITSMADEVPDVVQASADDGVEVTCGLCGDHWDGVHSAGLCPQYPC